MIPYTHNVKRLAKDIIATSLNDLRSYDPGRNYHLSNIDKKNYDDALSWFKDGSASPMGYRWCLQYSELNGNLVKKAIKEFTRDK
jgi:hypothetical protein